MNGGWPLTRCKLPESYDIDDGDLVPIADHAGNEISFDPAADPYPQADYSHRLIIALFMPNSSSARAAVCSAISSIE